MLFTLFVAGLKWGLVRFCRVFGTFVPSCYTFLGCLYIELGVGTLIPYPTPFLLHSSLWLLLMSCNSTTSPLSVSHSDHGDNDHNNLDFALCATSKPSGSHPMDGDRGDHPCPPSQKMGPSYAQAIKFGVEVLINLNILQIQREFTLHCRHLTMSQTRKTVTNEKNTRLIIQKMGFDHFDYTLPQNRAGGLWVLWNNNNCHAPVMAKENHAIHMLVYDPHKLNNILVSGVYAPA
ncbi:hypothetical protein Cgig2_018767 [Carnegiea gigantea]|uniref:Uncharacterized protein n=1 Tax=Carnegiea gigantea TaxID=171969 RepID=A0A9Q1GUK9_9CARY|nr:hypothetical protein Cgig2_018767 [Carnegiea gigantea]